jgi:hypothetical protein
VTTYRVGEAGATVFDPEGKPMARLRPGSVVVEGTIETARLPAADRPKRLSRYADKRRVSAEDKAT